MQSSRSVDAEALCKRALKPETAENNDFGGIGFNGAHNFVWGKKF